MSFLCWHFNFSSIVNHITFHFLIYRPCTLLYVLLISFWIYALQKCRLVIDVFRVTMHLAQCRFLDCCCIRFLSANCAVLNCVALKLFTELNLWRSFHRKVQCWGEGWQSATACHMWETTKYLYWRVWRWWGLWLYFTCLTRQHPHAFHQLHATPGALVLQL